MYLNWCKGVWTNRRTVPATAIDTNCIVRHDILVL